MKNKILLSIALILLPFAVISFLSKKTNFNLPKKVEKSPEVVETIKLNDNGTITQLNLEDYVVGVIAGEMPASFELEALKAQAVASRTYAIYKRNQNNYYDVLPTTADQVYLTTDQMQQKWQDSYQKYYSKIQQAVLETQNQILKYNDEVIKAYYFAMSNGYTEDAVNVFNETQNYLTSVESKGEEQVAQNLITTINYSQEEFCQKLSISCSSIKISNIKKSSSGRVLSLMINDQEFLGTKIRSLLNLRSTDFVINVKDTVEITTKGYGHGVGMSQYGANAMAKEGATYEEILKHYYQDVTISPI